MALSTASIHIEKINFRFSIPQISELDGVVWSPEVLMNGVPWKICAYKNTRGAEPWLGLFLSCTKSDETSNWSHVASATFELLPFKSGSAAKKRETRPHVHDRLSKPHGFTEAFRWADLFDEKNGYVKDDTVNLQIGIQEKTSNANVNSFESISKSCDQGCSSKFRMTVSNIEELSAVKSPEIFLQKIPCALVLFKYSNNLGIRLLSIPNDSVSLDLKLSVELTAELISSHVSLKRSEKVQALIGECGLTIRISDLISWDELLDPANGFIKDGTITIEFVIKTERLQGGNVTKRNATDDHQPTAKHLKLECRICEEDIIDRDISSLPCGHVFCSPCITESIKVRKVCPSCGVRATQHGVRRILLPKLD